MDWSYTPPYYHYNGYRESNYYEEDDSDYKEGTDIDSDYKEAAETDSAIFNVRMHPTYSGTQFYISQFSQGNKCCFMARCVFFIFIH